MYMYTNYVTRTRSDALRDAGRGALEDARELRAGVLHTYTHIYVYSIYNLVYSFINSSIANVIMVTINIYIYIYIYIIM